MSNSVHLISLLLLASGLSLHAQEKRAMTFDEMVGWELIILILSMSVRSRKREMGILQDGTLAGRCDHPAI